MCYLQLFALLVLTTSMVSANDYGNNGGTKSSFSSESSQPQRGRGAIHRFTGGWTGGVIPAAIQTTHNVEVRPVNLPSDPIQPAVVLVDAGMIPLTILFRSMSSALNVMQQHVAGEAAEEQHTKSEDEPHRLMHEVTKPIIQEVREVIAPYRRVVQEIQPVQEEIQTIVARGQERVQNGGFFGSQHNNNNYGPVAMPFPAVSQQPISNFGSGFGSKSNFGTGSVGHIPSYNFNQNTVTNSNTNTGSFSTGSFGTGFGRHNDHFEQNRISSHQNSVQTQVQHTNDWSNKQVNDVGGHSYKSNAKDMSVPRPEPSHEQVPIQTNTHGSDSTSILPSSQKNIPQQTTEQQGVQGEQGGHPVRSNNKLTSPAKKVRAKSLSRNRNAQNKNVKA